MLILFSSFADVHEWWKTTNSWLDTRNYMWESEIPKEQFPHFNLEAKTVVYVGEVAYSDATIPIAQAVNEVFKVEKFFKSRELGVTEAALLSIAPVLRDLNLKPRRRGAVRLPGARTETNVFVLDKDMAS